uniref:hypothetical protein n=1 Tax=Algoriphagus sp. TaxID=1872435 RepID=UPI00404765E5
MLKRILIFLLGILFSLTVHAKDPEFYRLRIAGNRWEIVNRESFFEGRVTRSIFNQLDSIYKDNSLSYELIYSPKPQSLKVYAQCSFDFYSIRDNQIIKDYKYANRGYTCGSLLFERNNKYHILGGLGLWNSHSDLMQFDSLKGSWEFQFIQNQPLDYFPLGMYQNSKGIIALFGNYKNPRIPKIEKENAGYFVDLEKKAWVPLKIEVDEFEISDLIEPNLSYFYETQDYSFFVSKTEKAAFGWIVWILFEKETGKIYLFEGTKDDHIFISPIHEFIGNKINYIKYLNGDYVDGEEVQIDLDEVKKNSREIGKIVLLEPTTPTKKSSTSSFLPWLGLVLLPLGFWAGIQLQKRTQKKVNLSLENDPPQENVQEEKEEEILDHLLAHNGEKLSTEAFDQLLGIHEISNFDSKRIKRSRLIKSLNKQYEEKNGFPLITRIKNPDDKRFIFYKITFKNES